MTKEHERAIYRLLRVPRIGPGGVGRVLAAWREQPDLSGAFWGRAAEEYRTRWGLSSRSARFLRDAGASDDEWQAADTDAAGAEAAQVEILAVLEGSYAALADARDLPPVLFTRGNQDLLWDAGVAIADSRAATEEALEWGARLATALTEAGHGLITGHNRDGYRRSAAAAKRTGSPVVIVLDRPLHGEPAAGPQAVPVGTARLWDPQFHPERELVLTDAGPRAVWTPAHARRRDTLILGLATRIVAGAVRPGGIMAELCARAVRAGKPVFLSPFCKADLSAARLPVDIAAACATVIETQPEPPKESDSSGGQPSIPQPSWLQRRWAAEIAAFVAALEAVVGPGARVERRLANDSARQHNVPAEIRAVVLLPASPAEQVAEIVVIVGGGSPPGGADETARVLSPGSPITDLETFRAYLTRCRARLAALSTPLTSAWPVPDRAPIPGSRPSPE